MIKLKQVIYYSDTNSVEATWVDELGKQVKCHSYSDAQLDMLRTDLGASVDSYLELITAVEANIQPSPQLPPPSPVSCSPWQIRKALNAAGKRADVEAYLSSPAATQEEKDGWEFATEFRSDDSFVLAVGALLGLNSEQVRDFMLGASLL